MLYYDKWRYCNILISAISPSPITRLILQCFSPPVILLLWIRVFLHCCIHYVLFKECFLPEHPSSPSGLVRCAQMLFPLVDIVTLYFAMLENLNCSSCCSLVKCRWSLWLFVNLGLWMTFIHEGENRGQHAG